MPALQPPPCAGSAVSQPILRKVYASISRAAEGLADELKEAVRDAVPADESPAETVSEDGGLVLVSFEGLWFPVEEAAACIKRHLVPETAGKMDVLDLENWTITRFTLQGGFMQERSGSLNSALDYSGF